MWLFTFIMSAAYEDKLSVAFSNLSSGFSSFFLKVFSAGSSKSNDSLVTLTPTSNPDTDDIALFSTNQIQALTTAQIVGLSTSQIQRITTDGIAALNTAQVSSLTNEALAVLNSAQLRAIETIDIQALRTSQIDSLSTAALAAFNTNQIEALTTTQVSSLSTALVQALTTDQIRAIESRDLAVLKTQQLSALLTAQIQALSPDQNMGFTTAQTAVFTTAQFAAFTAFSPVVLDLNGDGVKTQSISTGIKFDLFADGSAVNTGWVSSGDGLLVLDRNHDGVINDGSELFGEATQLANGRRASDGYAALRELDANTDGVIDSKDAVFDDLRVWVDSNADATTGVGELRSLSSLGITKINLNTLVGTQIDNGNLLGLTSSYETVDGKTHDAADVWFLTNRVGGDGVPVTAQVDDTLRNRVSSLAQAISIGDSFGENGALGAPEPTATLNAGVSGNPLLNTTPASLAVVSMTDAMRRFDADGKTVAGFLATDASGVPKIVAPQDPSANGFLAVGAKT